MVRILADGGGASCAPEDVCSHSAKPAPVILLHGFAQCGATWNEIAEGLQARGRVVYAPDLVELSEAFSLKAVCDRVAGLVRTVARVCGTPPVLVGYSMGGRVVLEMLVQQTALGADVDAAEVGADAHAHATAPSRSQWENSITELPGMCCRTSKASFFGGLPLSGVLIEGAGLGPTDDRARRELEERNLKWAREVRALGVEAFMSKWESLALFATQQNLPAQTRARLRAERTANSAEALACMFEKWGQHHQADEAGALAALAHVCQCGVPVTYVAGALDEKYRAVSDRVSAAVPGVHVVVVPGAGHNVHVEDPGAFLEVIDALA